VRLLAKVKTAKAAPAYTTEFCERGNLHSLLRKFGSSEETKTENKDGKGNGQFDWPTSVTCDLAGNLVVTERRNNRVQFLTPDGVFITAFAVRWPWSVCVDREGRTIVGGISFVNVFAFVD